VVLTGFLPVFPLFLFPTFFGFASSILQLARSFSGRLLGVLCNFVSRLAHFERSRVPVALLSFALGVALSSARARATAYG
jgi:hypothetical protein